MQDLILVIASIIVVGAIFVAIPVAGVVIGLFIGGWFGINAWKEERNASKRS